MRQLEDAEESTQAQTGPSRWSAVLGKGARFHPILDERTLAEQRPPRKKGIDAASRARVGKSPNDGGRPERLTRAHIGLIILNVLLAAIHAAVGSIVASGVPLFVPVYSLKFGVLTQGTAWRITLSAPVKVGSFNIVAALASMFYATSALHAGNAFFWTRYVDGIQACILPFRWVEYAVTASLMMFILAYLVGLMLVELLVPIVGLVCTTMAFGLLQEASLRPRNGSYAKPHLGKFAVHLLGWVPQLAAWFPLCYTFLRHASRPEEDAMGIRVRDGPREDGEDVGGSRIDAYGSYEIPSWVVWLALAELFLFLSFALPNFVQPFLAPRQYVYCEWVYCSLSLISKTLLGLTVYANVIVMDDFASLYLIGVNGTY